jgi:hypothetical protein
MDESQKGEKGSEKKRSAPSGETISGVDWW